MSAFRLLSRVNLSKLSYANHKLASVNHKRVYNLLQRQYRNYSEEVVDGISKATPRPPPTGLTGGGEDDPEVSRDDEGFPGEPAHTYPYRDNLGPPPIWDPWLAKMVGTMIWSYVFYMFYWHSDMFFFQEFYYPDPTVEFTDKELGIPKDDEADPEYWGEQQAR